MESDARCPPVDVSVPSSWGQQKERSDSTWLARGQCLLRRPQSSVTSRQGGVKLSQRGNNLSGRVRNHARENSKGKQNIQSPGEAQGKAGATCNRGAWAARNRGLQRGAATLQGQFTQAAAGSGGKVAEGKVRGLLCQGGTSRVPAIGLQAITCLHSQHSSAVPL